MRPTRRAKALSLVLLLCLLQAACQRVTKDMAEQPRYNPATTSPSFPDGQASRPPPPGSVAHASGDLAYASGGRAGEKAAAADDEAVAPATTDALLLRGHERYEIYCLPCHGTRGGGDGEVVRRGFPRPPGLATAALRAAPDSRLQEIILRGSGTMYPFADRVSVADAWAIVAYLRVLQQSGESAAVAPGEGAR